MVRKASVRCPHCEFVQNEPVAVVSTYCRGCGQYFRVGRAPGPPPVEAPQLRAVQQRRISCFACGTTHEVSTFAETSMCPNCTAHIDLRDVTIAHSVSRMVDTRGFLHVLKGASLTNMSSICGSALLEGGWTGRLYCDGTAQLVCRGRFGSELIAQLVVIDKHADVTLLYPIRAAEVIVRGRLSARIFCSGKVRVERSGELLGDVDARAISVDKGGVYDGAIVISAVDSPAPPEDHPYASPGPDVLRVARRRTPLGPNGERPPLRTLA